MNGFAIKAYKTIHVIWTTQIIIVTALTCLSPHKHFDIKLLTLTVSAIMLLVSIGLVRNNNRMWLYSAIILVGYWALHGWKSLLNFVINNYMFFSNDPLYIDSPATIMVVYINAVFGILPASILIFIMLTNIINIIKLFKDA